ncbi:MAG: ATP-binding protein, partial [Campylobacterales bacterium]|nr:ATP-binding protein [Campylobacterales bacterium]
MKKSFCSSLVGLNAVVIDVEASFLRAIPSFNIVGLADSSIQESKERIKSALDSINFKFPPLKITLNLSPSEIRKSGSHFDLPIALLIATFDKEIDLSQYFIYGELGLDGTIKDTKEIFIHILSLAKQNLISKVICSNKSAKKIANIPNIEIYGFDNLQEIIQFFDNQSLKENFTNHELNFDSITLENEKYYFINSFEMDFHEVRGQEIALRAALISACGFHNILLEGSPGCGKSMIAKRLRYILPPMSREEILQKAVIDTFSNKEPDFKPFRSFRNPHHTSTPASIFGGGSKD